MSTLTQKSVQPTTKPMDMGGVDQTPALDVSKVKIILLPRRNDTVYMRGVRRRRA